MNTSRKKRIRKTKVQRQLEIVDATLRLIARYGVQGTTVSRISAAVGLTKSGFYQHFRSRDQVLVAALDALGGESSTWISQPASPDALGSLLDLVHGHSTWSPSEYTTFVRPFFEFVSGAEAMQLTKPVSERIEKDWRSVVDRVEEGMNQGTISNDVDAEDVAWSVMMLLWAEDLSQLMGVNHLFIDGGASKRIFDRLMTTYLTRNPSC